MAFKPNYSMILTPCLPAQPWVMMLCKFVNLQVTLQALTRQHSSMTVWWLHEPYITLFSHLLYLCRVMLQFINMLLEFYILAFLFIQLCLHYAQLLLWHNRHSKLEHQSCTLFSHAVWQSVHIKKSISFYFYDLNQQKTEHSKINRYLK